MRRTEGADHGRPPTHRTRPVVGPSATVQRRRIIQRRHPERHPAHGAAPA